MRISLCAMLHVFFHRVCHPDDRRSRGSGGAPHAALRRSTGSDQTSLAHVRTREQQTHSCPLEVQPLSVGLHFHTLPMGIVLPSQTSWSLLSSQQSCGRTLNGSLIAKRYHYFEIPKKSISKPIKLFCPRSNRLLARCINESCKTQHCIDSDNRNTGLRASRLRCR